MDAVRRIYKKLPGKIDAPKSLKNRKVEVIMLPLEEDNAFIDISRPEVDTIKEFIGAWKGEPIIRPDQGEFEIREPLE
ncbi:MAG: hypothetical protein ACOC23_06690 [Thermodesulfobacteriota bacterium]